MLGKGRKRGKGKRESEGKKRKRNADEVNGRKRGMQCFAVRRRLGFSNYILRQGIKKKKKREQSGQRAAA